MTRELAHWESDGVEVTLLWTRETNALTVSVNDWRTNNSFELQVGDASAMDVFDHPFAYAAFRGLAPEPVAAA